MLEGRNPDSSLEEARDGRCGGVDGGVGAIMGCRDEVDALPLVLFSLSLGGVAALEDELEEEAATRVLPGRVFEAGLLPLTFTADGPGGGRGGVERWDESTAPPPLPP